MSEYVGETVRIERLGHRNPVEVLHKTHTGRYKIRDRYGYGRRVEAEDVEVA